MRFFNFAFGFLLLLSAALAVPVDYDEDQSSGSGSRTWTAMKNFFQPVADWFRDELPGKTPTDLAKDVTDKVTDVKDWTDDSKIIQSAKDAITPFFQWIKDTVNTLKAKSFKEMFEDTKHVASRVDQTVGGWIEGKDPTPVLH